MSSNTRVTRTKNILTVDACSPTVLTSPSLLEGIEKKLLEQREFFTAQLKLLENKIMQSIGAVSAELSDIRSEFKMMVERQNTLEDKCYSFSNDIDRLHSQVSLLENGVVSCDLIVLNVPNDINATVAVESIAKTLNCESIAINKVFRTSNNVTDKRSVPIVVKLKSPDERVNFFRSLAAYRKKNKRSKLNLSDVGFSGDGELVFRESLTNYNKIIFKSALEYKRKKLIYSVYSLRGCVYVRATDGSVPVKIANMMSLREFVGERG